MHHHVTGKVCPNPWCVNQSRLSEWQKFKQRLVKDSVKEADDEVVTEGKAVVNGKEYKIDRILKDNTNFIKASNFENMGFDVGFNKDTKAIVIKNEITEMPVIIKGNDTRVEAINVDGYNYVPIRSIAEALGLKIRFNNGKVIID